MHYRSYGRPNYIYTRAFFPYWELYKRQMYSQSIINTGTMSDVQQQIITTEIMPAAGPEVITPVVTAPRVIQNAER